MSKIRLFGTSSGYVEIAPAAAAGNNTLTAPSTVGEIIAKDAAGAIGITSMKASNVNVGAAVTITESGIEASGIGITVANINGGQIGGRRNIIINGAMMVAQRGTSSTTAGYLIDRQNVYFDGLDEALTMAQADVSSGTGPYNEGFRKSLKLTNGNQTSGAGSGDRIQPQNKIEAQDIANSGWKYTDPNSFITISFWVKSSVAQTFYGYLRSKDGTEQRYAYSAALSANTWTKVIKTIPGNSNLQFDNDANEGLQWNILLPFIGTDLTDSGVSLNSWGAYAGGTRTPDNTSTWYTTNDATFELTGLQLEVGTQATSFEHRGPGEDLALCQRYFYRIGGKGNAYQLVGNGFIGLNGGTRCAKVVINFPTTMRATPTLSVIGTDSFSADTGGAAATFPCTATGTGGGLWSAASTGDIAWLDFGRTSGGEPAVGTAVVVYTTGAAGECSFTAEL